MNWLCGLLELVLELSVSPKYANLLAQELGFTFRCCPSSFDLRRKSQKERAREKVAAPVRASSRTS